MVSFQIACLFFFLLENAYSYTISGHATKLHMSVPTLEQSSNRRAFLVNSAASTLGLSTLITSSPSNAVVYEDPDRYGDKELKVSFVNKIRQNIRDAILVEPGLAPLFLKIALQDALTYDASTQEGGQDGSILAAILAKDAPESLLELKDAAQKLEALVKKLKAKTEITKADIVAFAGAEAIESAGGPRIAIQLGKLDPKIPNIYSKDKYPNLCGQGIDVIRAFQRAGLSEREVSLVYGTIGSMEEIAKSSKKFGEDQKEEEENEMGDTEVYIPSSFGAPSEIYGKQLDGGKVSIDFLKKVASDIKYNKKTVATDVFMDEKVSNYVVRYSTNAAGFLKDLPAAYIKLMSLGAVYTGGKMGNLLGGQEASM